MIARSILLLHVMALCFTSLSGSQSPQTTTSSKDIISALILDVDNNLQSAYEADNDRASAYLRQAGGLIKNLQGYYDLNRFTPYTAAIHTHDLLGNYLPNLVYILNQCHTIAHREAEKKDKDYKQLASLSTLWRTLPTAFAQTDPAVEPLLDAMERVTNTIELVLNTQDPQKKASLTDVVLQYTKTAVAPERLQAFMKNTTTSDKTIIGLGILNYIQSVKCGPFLTPESLNSTFQDSTISYKTRSLRAHIEDKELRSFTNLKETDSLKTALEISKNLYTALKDYNRAVLQHKAYRQTYSLSAVLLSSGHRSYLENNIIKTLPRHILPTPAEREFRSLLPQSHAEQPLPEEREPIMSEEGVRNSIKSNGIAGLFLGKEWTEHVADVVKDGLTTTAHHLNKIGFGIQKLIHKIEGIPASAQAHLKLYTTEDLMLPYVTFPETPFKYNATLLRALVTDSEAELKSCKEATENNKCFQKSTFFKSTYALPKATELTQHLIAPEQDMKLDKQNLIASITDIEHGIDATEEDLDKNTNHRERYEAVKQYLKAHHVYYSRQLLLKKYEEPQSPMVLTDNNNVLKKIWEDSPLKYLNVQYLRISCEAETRQAIKALSHQHYYLENDRLSALQLMIVRKRCDQNIAHMTAEAERIKPLAEKKQQRYDQLNGSSLRRIIASFFWIFGSDITGLKQVQQDLNNTKNILAQHQRCASDYEYLKKEFEAEVTRNHNHLNTILKSFNHEQQAILARAISAPLYA